MKGNLSHFLSQYQEGSSKEHGREKPEKLRQTAAIELWRAKVPLSNIRKQLKMPERTLRRILSFTKAIPLNPIKPRKLGSGRPRKISGDQEDDEEEAVGEP
jgi:hypothetical protein